MQLGKAGVCQVRAAVFFQATRGTQFPHLRVTLGYSMCVEPGRGGNWKLGVGLLQRPSPGSLWADKRSVSRSEIPFGGRDRKPGEGQNWKGGLVPRLAFVLWFLLCSAQGMGHQALVYFPLGLACDV